MNAKKEDGEHIETGGIRMSYDIDIINKISLVSYDISTSSITYNVREMLIQAFEHEDGIYSIDNLNTKDAIVKVAKACYNIAANVDAYKEYESPNGWGTVDTTLKLLTEWLSAMVEHSQDTYVKII